MSAVGEDLPWLRVWAERWVRWPRPSSVDAAEQLLLRDLRVARAQAHVPDLRAVYWPAPTPRSRVRADIPVWDSPADLAADLGLDPATLAWLADLRGLERTARRHQRRYDTRWIPKRDGSLRTIEMPRARLRAVQHRILREVLDHLPISPAATGFRRGRGVRDHAAAHTGQRAVLKLDLESFFPSTTRRQVTRVFEDAGYVRPVARLLAGLCTTVTPIPARPTVVRDAATVRAEQVLRAPHLPQGAATSPALANLCARRLDRRLTGLADALGLRYTRYADDLALSGDVSTRTLVWVAERVTEIAAEEGWRVRPDKTAVRTRSQRQALTGLVVNHTPGVSRTERDALRALLFNCVRHGPSSQNHEGRPDFRAHLVGRVAWVAHVNPGQAVRLRALLDRIVWDEVR